MEQNKWQLILHDKQEDPYYEITSGPISLAANCGYVGETEADEQRIFEIVTETLNNSRIDFWSENPLELTQHIEIQKLGYENSELQARCDGYEKTLRDNYATDFIDYIRNERNYITKEMLSDEWWLNIPASKRVVFENILIAYDQMVDRLAKLGAAIANEALNGEAEKEVELSCMVCGDKFMGPEPKMCCSGRDCGCMGLPTEPIVCSKECYDNLPNKRNQKEDKK